MTKDELIGILSIPGVALNEGESAAINVGGYPRIVFWEMEWEDEVSSDEVYRTLITYQVSLFSKEPRSSWLLDLRQRLRDAGVYTRIFHEYISDQRCFHSYMSVEVRE